MNIVCSICTEIFTGQDNETISSTICGHVFHNHCIISWIEDAKTCPICRRVQTINQIMKLNLHTEGNVVDVAQLKENCKIATDLNEELRIEIQILKDENLNLRNKLEARRSNSGYAATMFDSDEDEEDGSQIKDADNTQTKIKEVILNSAVDRITELEKKVLELEQENETLRQMYFT